MKQKKNEFITPEEAKKISNLPGSPRSAVYTVAPANDSTSKLQNQAVPILDADGTGGGLRSVVQEMSISQKRVVPKVARVSVAEFSSGNYTSFDPPIGFSGAYTLPMVEVSNHLDQTGAAFEVYTKHEAYVIGSPSDRITSDFSVLIYPGAYAGASATIPAMEFGQTVKIYVYKALSASINFSGAGTVVNNNMPPTLQTTQDLLIFEVEKTLDGFNTIINWLNPNNRDGIITTPRLGESIVYSRHIGQNTIASSNLAQDCVEERNIKNSAVTAGKLASGAVTSDKIAAGAVSTSKIQNQAITQQLMADAAVGTRSIIDNSVTASKLGDASVTARTIGVGAVEGGKTLGSRSQIKPLSISGGDIGERTITSFNLAPVVPAFCVFRTELRWEAGIFSVIDGRGKIYVSDGVNPFINVNVSAAGVFGGVRLIVSVDRPWAFHTNLGGLHMYLQSPVYSANISGFWAAESCSITGTTPPDDSKLSLTYTGYTSSYFSNGLGISSFDGTKKYEITVRTMVLLTKLS